MKKLLFIFSFLAVFLLVGCEVYVHDDGHHHHDEGHHEGHDHH